jgi:hypothetical protein
MIIAHKSTAGVVAIRRLPVPLATNELRTACILRLRRGQAPADADLSSSEDGKPTLCFVDGSIATPYLKNTSLKLEP